METTGYVQCLDEVYIPKPTPQEIAAQWAEVWSAVDDGQ